MIQRTFKLPEKHSFFLFGARGTGKSTLLQTMLPEETTYFLDLLDYDLETRLTRRPSEFKEIIEALPPTITTVVIDEVQKLPFLLDEVHHQLETNKNRCFVLTGSSARKLKRGQANLLAGRAFSYTLHPFTSLELGSLFNLEHALAFGTLPKLFSLDNDRQKKDFLRAYTQTYMREEIQQEGLLRNLPAFRIFLPLVAEQNGQILAWSNFARDVGVDAKTIRSYFEILEDTLLGFFLPPYSKSIRQRQKNHPKFYLFDTGVKRALANELTLPVISGNSEYGRAFEHFWITEVFRLNNYYQTDYTFSYFATNDIEIDLVVERPGKPMLFIEIKSSEHVKDIELRAIRQLSKEHKNSQAICVCREPRKRLFDNVLVCPWTEFIAEVFGSR